MRHLSSICIATILLAAMSGSALAQSADIQRIMLEQASSTRVGEVRHASRPPMARAQQPAQRVRIARHKPILLKTRPLSFVANRSAPIAQVASNGDVVLNGVPAMTAPETVTNPVPDPVTSTMSYGPTARTVVSEAFDAIDRLEQERALAAPKNTVPEAASRGDVFQWVWSGLRDTWRSLGGRD
jgi:hypothetical protein